MTKLRTSLFATIGVAIVCPAPLQADDLKTCPSAQVKGEIREAAGSSIDALMNSVEIVEKRFGPPHSRKRVSPDEVRLIYRFGKGAVSVSLARGEGGRVAIDCIAY